MPSVKRSSHSPEIDGLRERIVQLEAQLAESYDLNRRLRNVDAFAARHLASLGFGLGLFAPDWSQSPFVGSGVGRIFGCPPEQFQAEPRSWLLQVEPSDLPSVESALTAAAGGTEPAEVTYRILRTAKRAGFARDFPTSRF